MTRKEKILFIMSVVRTICALVSGIGTMFVIWKVYGL